MRKPSGRGQIPGVEAGARREYLPERRVVRDRLVHPRLRDGGIVHFAVAVTPIADEIDHDVAAKGAPERGGQASHAGDGG